MQLTAKQNEYIRNANHRWNVKSGATRSGKTFMDIAFVIPNRIRERIGEDGLCVFLGNTQGTLTRNIIEPLQKMWGTKLVGNIRSDNTADIFGEKVYCLGADKANQVDRIRGSSIKYCYGDEVVTWNKGVFDMLKTRLDKACSCFDGTCNPDNPNHWFKKFLESDADIYLQKYQIYDNKYLPEGFIPELENELRGTVDFDRYILGKWKAAEGAIYKNFADAPQKYTLDAPPDDIAFCTLGMDFGGNGSAHAIICTGYSRGLQKVVVVDEYYRKEVISPLQLERDTVDFVRRCKSRFKITDMYCDSAEQVLIKGIKGALAREKIPLNVHNARKGAIIDRIRFTCLIMATGRFFIVKNCKHLIEAFSDAVWDGKKLDDTRLDDGSINIDSLDAFEYSIEPYMKDILDVSLRRNQ